MRPTRRVPGVGALPELQTHECRECGVMQTKPLEPGDELEKKRTPTARSPSLLGYVFHRFREDAYRWAPPGYPIFGGKAVVRPQQTEQFA